MSYSPLLLTADLWLMLDMIIAQFLSRYYWISVLPRDYTIFLP